MGKGFIMFEGERLVPNFEEDMHVLMNSLHCTQILVLMPPEDIYFSKFWCLLLYLDGLEGTAGFTLELLIVGSRRLGMFLFVRSTKSRALSTNCVCQL